MKKVFLACLAVFIVVEASAQNQKFYTEHRFAVELSTGYPYMLDLINPPGREPNSLTTQARNAGQVLQSIQPPLNINLGLTYYVGNRWELSAYAGVHGWFYTRTQYPQFEDVTPDTSGTPEWKKLEYNHRGVYVAAALRYNWFERETVKLYSSAGLGYSFSGRLPIPCLTPIGVHFGRKRWYGLAEATFSAAAIGLQLGVGFRI